VTKLSVKQQFSFEKHSLILPGGLILRGRSKNTSALGGGGDWRQRGQVFCRGGGGGGGEEEKTFP